MLAKEFNLNPIRLCVIKLASFSTQHYSDVKKKIYRGKLTKAVTTLHFLMAYHVDLKNIQAWPQCHEEWYRNLSDGLQSGGGGLPYMSYIGMCCCEAYGFQAVYSSTG